MVRPGEVDKRILEEIVIAEAFRGVLGRGGWGPIRDAGRVPQDMSLGGNNKLKTVIR